MYNMLKKITLVFFKCKCNCNLCTKYICSKDHKCTYYYKAQSNKLKDKT